MVWKTHKQVFFFASYTHYDRCPAGEFRLVPDGDQLDALRAGYDSMRATGLLSLSAPDFATLMADIRDAERSINASF